MIGSVGLFVLFCTADNVRCEYFLFSQNEWSIQMLKHETQRKEGTTTELIFR